jgi:hypothetical protein
MALPEEYLKKSPEQQEAAMLRAIAAYKKADPSERKLKGREALIELEADQQNQPLSVTVPPEQGARLHKRTSIEILIRAWQPSRNGKQQEALAVQFNGLRMTRHQYEMQLEARFKELIDQDPQQAYRVLSNSEEHLPDLYEIAMGAPSRDWPSLIMTCGQMQMLLNRIDWNKGRSVTLGPEEMPSLEAMTEAIPS